MLKGEEQCNSIDSTETVNCSCDTIFKLMVIKYTEGNNNCDMARKLCCGAKCMVLGITKVITIKGSKFNPQRVVRAQTGKFECH
jgi:hypothetical protein